MAEPDANGVAYDLHALLSSEDRDFLIRNNGDQVKINYLSGKLVGLYFSGSWCGPCRMFTPKLVQVYQELSSKADFEVVFISTDRDDESFDGYFSKMPWPAIPFSDLAIRKHLRELFKVRGIPHLVILDVNGKVLNDKGDRLVKDYGVDAYPFTPERINFLKEQEEEAKRNQSLSSLLVSTPADYLISNDANKVLVSDLEGKMVGLYFVSHSHRPYQEFTAKLVEIYKKLKEKGENFEIVFISLDNEEESFKRGLETMPWLALPFSDRRCQRLINYFELEGLPTLTILGLDGKTLNPNVADLIEDHGIEAYPFTPEKVIELAEIEKAKQEAQTLESILVLGEKDFVIEKNGSQVPVSELVGKTILLYFSAHWCPPCRAFLPKLIKLYDEIKAKDNAFEVIFISSDRDQASFNAFFASMPWLALPFGDERKAFLQRKFKIRSIPAVIAIGSTGRTVTKEARQLITVHGADAYPFTEEHLKQLEEKLDEKAKGWPEKMKNEVHVEHELERIKRNGYRCDGCQDIGHGWSYSCKRCNFDLHPKCALKEGEGKDKAAEGKEGWTCDGDICRKA